MSEETSREMASGNEFHGDPVSANLKPVSELVDDGRPQHGVNNANTRRMKPQTRVHPSSELRQRAEVHLSEVIEKAVPRLASKDVKALVNELQIYQIELEVQNLELEQARLEAEDSRDRYRDLFESAPVAYCSLDQDGRIREMNRAPKHCSQSIARRSEDSRSQCLWLMKTCCDSRLSTAQCSNRRGTTGPTSLFVSGVSRRRC